MMDERKGTMAKLQLARLYVKFNEAVLVVFLEPRLLYGGLFVRLIDVAKAAEIGDRDRSMSLITLIGPWFMKTLCDPTLLVIRDPFWITCKAA